MIAGGGSRRVEDFGQFFRLAVQGVEPLGRKQPSTIADLDPKRRFIRFLQHGRSSSLNKSSIVNPKS